MTFTANVSGGTQSSTTFNWTVSAGTITSGQGTSTITVATNADLAGQTITATVDVGGQCAADCPRSANASGEVAAPKPTPEPRKIDEFGALEADDLKIRLENLRTELANDPAATGYIITSGSGKAKTKQLNNIKKAIDFLRIDSSRVRLVDGDATAPVGSIIWIQPAGANAPPGM